MKKNLLFAFFLIQITCLSAQKGAFEFGVNGGINVSSAVNFKENRLHHWDMKPLKGIQLGVTFGYRFNDFYSFRLGINLERRGFKDSTYLNGHARFFPGVDEYTSGYVSIPLLNEFHFLNHHLIASVGVDFAKDFYEDGNEFGIIAGIGTGFNITQRMKWRLDVKFNRGLKDWRYHTDYFYLDGLKTFNISTGLIYSFEKKKK